MAKQQAKGKTIMASKKSTNGHIKTPSDDNVTVEFKHYSEVFPDLEWNGRHKSFRTGNVGLQNLGASSTEDTSQGIEDLINSLLADGQDEAIVCRLNPGKNAKSYPLAVVTGFRRVEAITVIAERAAKNAELPEGDRDERYDMSKAVCRGMIKVEVRDLNEREARKLNIRENTVRDSLSAVDLAWTVHSLMKEWPDASSVEMGATIGRNQGYVAQLMRIGNKLSTKLFEAWRETNRNLSVDAVDEVAKLGKDSDEQNRAWELLVAKKAGSTNQGPAAWKDGATKRATEFGVLLGKLEESGLVTGNASAKGVRTITVDEILDFVPVGKMGKEDKEHHEVMAKAASTAWNEYMAAVKAETDAANAKKGLTSKKAAKPAANAN